MRLCVFFRSNPLLVARCGLSGADISQDSDHIRRRRRSAELSGTAQNSQKTTDGRGGPPAGQRADGRADGWLYLADTGLDACYGGFCTPGNQFPALITRPGPARRRRRRRRRGGVTETACTSTSSSPSSRSVPAQSGTARRSRRAAVDSWLTPVIPHSPRARARSVTSS